SAEIDPRVGEDSAADANDLAVEEGDERAEDGAVGLLKLPERPAVLLRGAAVRVAQTDDLRLETMRLVVLLKARGLSNDHVLRAGTRRLDADHRHVVLFPRRLIDRDEPKLEEALLDARGLGR